MCVALDRAIECFKSQSAMAEYLGVSNMAITQWKKRGVPAGRAKEIEDATGGLVKRHELRPDLFDGPSTKKQAAA